MDAITLAELRETPLSADEVLRAVRDDRAGGTTFFIGTVRDHDADRGVTALSYSAHPTAEARLREVLERTVTDSAASAEDAGGPGDVVYRVAALHRVGDLKIGDAAVIVAAAAAHRATAFAACRRLIDDIKAEVPIWKHQRFDDGAEEWVGTP